MRKLLLLGGAAGGLSIAVLLALSPAASARDPGAGPNFAAGHPYAAVPPGSHHGLKRGLTNGRPPGWSEGRKTGWNCRVGTRGCIPPGQR
jgi:hypothetical protein